jgi:iron complex transport system substrate-binding protein
MVMRWFKQKVRFLLVFFFFLMFIVGAEAVVVEDELGHMVDVPKLPQRILPLAPSLAEILFALGLDARIVGVTDFATYPKAALKKPRVGSFMEPNLEKILSLSPDLVVAGVEQRAAKIHSALAKFKIPLYQIKPSNLETIYVSIRNLGELTGTQAIAREVIAGMKEKVAVVTARVAGLPPKKVFYQVGVKPIVSVSRHAFAADLIDRAGGVLVTADNPVRYPHYPIERVIADAPDIIIISSMEPDINYQRFLNSWKRWSSIPAVRNGRIYVIQSEIVDRASPRIVDGLLQLAEFIHPSKP